MYLLNLSRSEPDLEANRPRHSLLLEPGMNSARASMAHTRLSMDSDGTHGRRSGDNSRRSGGLYRGGGAAMGGVEPLFEYEEGDGDEMEMESAEEGRGLVKGGG